MIVSVLDKERAMNMNNLTTNLFAICAISIGLAACAAKPPPKVTGKMMTGDEVAAWYLSGKATETSGTSTISGNSWTISRDGEGEQSIKSDSGSFSDTGTYRLEGNALCSKWVKIRDGNEACATLHAMPDGTYEAANEKGELIATFAAPVTK